MQNLFSDLEGLRISIEIETRGREFYKQAFDITADKSHKELFFLLMNEEIAHQDKFTEIFNKVKEKKEAHSEDYMFDPEASRYLTVIAEHQIFPKPSEAKARIAELKTAKAMLELALQAEKDSVLFYDELAKNAKFKESKEAFLMLKAEEQLHIIKIMGMLDSIK